MAGLPILSALSVATYESTDSIKTRLLSNYGSTSTRPGLSPAALGPDPSCGLPPPDQIRVQAYVEKMRVLNMAAGTWGFDGYLRLWWTDPRLIFNGTADGGCVDKLSLGTAEREMIWKPELYWEGAKDIESPSASKGTGQLLEVYPDGSIWWSRQMSFELSCPFSSNLDRVPFDTQTCSFMLGMYADTSFDSYLRWKEERVAIANSDGSACLSEWYVTDLAQEDVLLVYSSANYTYAQARVSFTRSPAVFMQAYLVPALLLVLCGYFGFYIDPMATPARVALGMLTIVVSANNFLGLINKLPVTLEPPWIARVVQACLYFNAIAMMGVVLVSFGKLSGKWLEAQEKLLDQQLPWKRALGIHGDRLIELFRVWDENGDGVVSKKEFRRGILKLQLVAKKVDINDLFDQYDTNDDQLLSIDELELLLKTEANKRLVPSSMRNSRSSADDEAAREEAAANDMDYDESEAATFNVGNVNGGAPTPPPKVPPPKVASVVPVVAGQEAGTHERVDPIDPSSKKVGNIPKKQLALSFAAIRRSYRIRAAEDLDFGKLWMFKVFTLFPVLERFSRSDHYMRVLFPIAFLSVFLSMFSEVNFGADQRDLLATSNCYNAISGQ